MKISKKSPKLFNQFSFIYTPYGRTKLEIKLTRRSTPHRSYTGENYKNRTLDNEECRYYTLKITKFQQKKILVATIIK